MERGDVPCSSLGADGALLTPPPSSDTSLQELIEAELRTRRAAEPEHTDVEHMEHAEHTEYTEHAEHMSEHTTVTAGLKSSRFVADQPESIMVLKSTRAGGRDSDEEGEIEVTSRVSEVTRQATAEAAESRQVTTRVTKITEEAMSEAMSEVTKVTEEAMSEVSEQMTQRVSEESAEFVSEQLTQKTSQQVSENASEYVREQASQQVSQQISQQVSEQVSHQVTEQVSQQVTEHVSEQISQQVTSHVTEEYTEHTSEVNGHVIEEITRRQSHGGARELPSDAAVDAAETASVHSGSDAGGGSRRSSASSDREPMSDRREETVTAEKLSAPPIAHEDVVVPVKTVESQQDLLDLEPEVEAKVEVDAEAEVPLVSIGNSEVARSRSPSERDDAEHQPAVSDVNVTDAADDVITTDVTAATDATDEVIETAKVTDEDSDEGVGGGSELRAGSDTAKKLRRKKKSDGADAEAGRRRSSFGKEAPPPADHSSRAPHVRSLDSSKAISRFNKDGGESASSECRSCGRKAFQMESVHAEGSVWHKTCFRCSQCSKHLTVDTYASHEGQLYCVVHHRQLLKAAAAHTTAAPAAAPAAATSVVDGATESGSRAADMVQGSDERTDGPASAEIVKSSNKTDYGLDELQHLNVKDRFSVFERTSGDEQEKTPTSVEVKRSQSILDKMKKFQGRTAARDPDSPEESDGSADEDIPRDPDTVRSSTKKERPIGLATGLGDVKNRFERGAVVTTPEKEQDKGEAAKMRSMICGAREHKLAYEEALREREAQAEAARRHREEPGTVVQGSLRESYERAVQEADSPRPSSREEAVAHRRAADLASKFERGPGDGATHNGVSPSEDLSGAADTSLTSDAGSGEMVREGSPDSGAAEHPAAPAPAADPELLNSDTAKRMLSKFKQMEQKGGHADEAAHGELSPNRERPQGNARQMLDKYRQMQEAAQKEDLPDGPRPLKSFTPPPEEPLPSSEDREDTEEDMEPAEDPDIVRASSKIEDEFLNKRTDQARSLRDKFESWAPPAERGFTVEEDCKPTLEITRNLRAKFESLKEQQKPQPPPATTQHRASKFIMEPSQAAEMCGACDKRVYAMERLEVDKRILHKNCFRCSKCNCVLRMDTYTFNAGKLFCTPHFKQMFITKGNYDEGFGVESRAKHWSGPTTERSSGAGSVSPRPSGELSETNGTASPDTNGAHSPEPEPREASPEPEREPSPQREASPEPEQRQASPEREQSPEREASPEREPEPEPQHREADVFQQVYESTVADGL